MEIAPKEEKIEMVVRESSLLVFNDDVGSSCNNSQAI